MWNLRGERRPWLMVCARSVTAAAAAMLCGCASAAYGPVSRDPAAAARGQALAEQACGACHGLGLSGASHFPGAAAFRDMRFDYNAISYERSLAHLHAGQIGMPPAELSLKDVGDIGAYIRSLQRPGGR